MKYRLLALAGMLVCAATYGCGPKEDPKITEDKEAYMKDYEKFKLMSPEDQIKWIQENPSIPPQMKEQRIAQIRAQAGRQ